MKLLIALVFLTALSTAAGYLCYTCSPSESYCSGTQDCAHLSDPRCYRSKMQGAGCMEAENCDMFCCVGELCNSGYHYRPKEREMSSAHITLPTVLVLLLGLTTSITLYLNQN